MDFELGDEAKDTITGFSGVVVARTEWLNGCWRLLLQSKKLDKNGQPTEPQQFDDKQLVLVRKKALPPEVQEKVGKKETGGPRDKVKDRAFPKQF